MKQQRHFIIFFTLILALLGGTGKALFADNITWSGTHNGFEWTTGSRTITLSGNVKLNGKVFVKGGSLTIDLNGYVWQKINDDSHTADACFDVSAGTLTIKSSDQTRKHYGG